MDSVGKNINNFKFPVCTIFKPKILFGELCYQFDVNNIQGAVKLTSGPFGGLTLALDYNEGRRLAGKSEKEMTLEDKQRTLGEFEITADNRFTAKIYIETLEPYTGYGAGRYVLNSVKEITGTEQYYNLAQKRKMCQIKESVSECFERKFSSQISQVCNCAPFQLYQSLASQVKLKNTIKGSSRKLSFRLHCAILFKCNVSKN